MSTSPYMRRPSEVSHQGLNRGESQTHEYEPVHEEVLSGVPPGPEQRGESILMSTSPYMRRSSVVSHQGLNRGESQYPNANDINIAFFSGFSPSRANLFIKTRATSIILRAKKRCKSTEKQRMSLKFETLVECFGLKKLLYQGSFNKDTYNIET